MRPILFDALFIVADGRGDFLTCTRLIKLLSDWLINSTFGVKQTLNSQF